MAQQKFAVYKYKELQPITDDCNDEVVGDIEEVGCCFGCFTCYRRPCKREDLVTTKV